MKTQSPVFYSGDYERPYPTPVRAIEESGKSEGSPELPQAAEMTFY